MGAEQGEARIPVVVEPGGREEGLFPMTARACAAVTSACELTTMWALVARIAPPIGLEIEGHRLIRAPRPRSRLPSHGLVATFTTDADVRAEQREAEVAMDSCIHDGRTESPGIVAVLATSGLCVLPSGGETALVRVAVA